MCTKFQVCTIFSSVFFQKSVMKTGRTHFSKNSADLSFQDISKRLLSDMLICLRYLEKKIHKDLDDQFSGNVFPLKKHLFVNIMKTR